MKLNPDEVSVFHADITPEEFMTAFRSQIERYASSVAVTSDVIERKKKTTVYGTHVSVGSFVLVSYESGNGKLIYKNTVNLDLGEKQVQELKQEVIDAVKAYNRNKVQSIIMELKQIARAVPASQITKITL